jgi:spore cortex protein
VIKREGFILNKKGLIVTASTVITALTLTACGTNNNNAMNDRDKVGYERVNFDNRPTNPYAVNDRYENVNYPNNRNNLARENVHFGNDRINEGLRSEYTNNGVIHDGKFGRNYSLPNQVRFNNDLNNAPLVPYTNISTNNYMNDGDRKYADQISKRVEQMANVDDANTVAFGNQVLVAVDLKNENVVESSLRSKIKDTLSPYTGGKKVYVTFDDGIANDIKNNIPNTTKNVLYDTKEGAKDIYRDVKNDMKDVNNNR